MKIFLAISLFLPCLLYATEQISDKLIYNGKHYKWTGYSPAFDTLKNFRIPEDAVETTANYGIYIVTYSIENDSLFLTDVTIITNSDKRLGTRSVFKDFFPLRNKIPMTAFSKIQAIPHGKSVEVTKHGWTDRHHDNYLIFEFDRGHVEAVCDLSYAGYVQLKSCLFKKFKKTSAYTHARWSRFASFQSLNAFRKKKFTLDQYLEFIILELVRTLGP